MLPRFFNPRGIEGAAGSRQILGVQLRRSCRRAESNHIRPAGQCSYMASGIPFSPSGAPGGSYNIGLPFGTSGTPSAASTIPGLGQLAINGAVRPTNAFGVG